LTVAGLANSTYDLDFWNGGQIAAIKGGEITKSDLGLGLRVSFPPAASSSYVTTTVVLQFRP
jgi:hypothetical protein